jgi:hypothetical protein
MTSSSHPANLIDTELQAQCRVDRYRGSGPGGQNRNKLETAIRLTHIPTGTVVTGTERRSQHDNLAAALWRMRLALAIAVRSPAYLIRDPSPLWVSRRSPGGQIAVNEHHPDLPLLLAEALDFLAAEGWQSGPAGQRLGVSPSQLLKLVHKDSHAFAHLNQERAKVGLGPLR